MEFIKKMQGWKLWLIWLLLSLVATYLLAMNAWQGADKTMFLPGQTTVGHYQIELKCDACHTPFMGVKQDACLECHKAELDLVNDSHPAKKFTNPGNAHLLEHMDAHQCLTCHKEHVPKQTHAMGVTVPTDYCFYCHEDIGKERPTHEGLGFDTCLDCHNFHDNRALYEDFLAKNLDQPKHAVKAELPLKTLLRSYGEMQSQSQQNVAVENQLKGQEHENWMLSVHQQKGVSCNDCHMQPMEASSVKQWTNSPDYNSCRSCHNAEVEGFLGGRHGMRLAQNLSPMTPQMARLPMKAESMHKELSCNSCHTAHRYDVQYAATDACMSCHDDAHSNNFTQTTHYKLWEKEIAGDIPAGQGVSCASCHLPRVNVGSKRNPEVRVMHNQNDYLRPNEKMARPVCMKCHGLEFTLDALVDSTLVENNYDRPPSVHLESMQWVKDRVEARESN